AEAWAAASLTRARPSDSMRSLKSRASVMAFLLFRRFQHLAVGDRGLQGRIGRRLRRPHTLSIRIATGSPMTTAVCGNRAKAWSTASRVVLWVTIRTGAVG